MRTKNTGGRSKERETRAAVLAGGLDMVITLTALLAARSTVLMADFFKTFLELVAVLLVWLVMRRINRGSDPRFEYGIGKLENLASLFVGILMVGCLIIVAGNAGLHIFHPAHISGIGIWISMASQIVYTGVNGALYWTSRRMAARNGSPIMASQARLFISKAFANVFILLSLTLSKALAQYAWSLYIDPIASLIIAGFILLAALGIVSSSCNDLLDSTLEEETQIVILRELARMFNEYEALHGIRSRRSGNRVFIDIFLEFAPRKTMAQVQPVIDAIRKNLEHHIQGCHVTIGLATRPVA
ncbi:MAG: cation diffusion facilitator family transporter [Verrucomicrobiota bacterium]